ncbi:MAG: DUF192 domain-containing protein [Proteobacteria bacterium]|nr:DUF192 domain-containing protein [Pseudomonadota bacterium]
MSKQNLKYAAFAAAVLAVILIVTGLALYHQGTTAPALFSEDQAVVISQNSARHVFRVEIAETPSQLAQGLMNRDHLPADHGMLFIFSTVEETSMWMHNTRIPLDMLFIDNDGKITHIAFNNRPYDDRRVSSGGPVRAALEINAGQVASLGIQVGDTVQNARLTRASGF